MEYIKGDLVGTEPITPEEVAQSLRLDSFNVNEINSLITAARESAEDYCNIDFVIKKYSIIADYVPVFFQSRRQPLHKIDSVKVYHNDDEEEAITNDYYIAHSNRIIRKAEVTPLSDLRRYDTTLFEVQCGMSSMPARVKEALLFFIFRKYHKDDPSVWVPAFRALLSDIKIRYA